MTSWSQRWVTIRIEEGARHTLSEGAVGWAKAHLRRADDPSFDDKGRGHASAFALRATANESLCPPRETVIARLQKSPGDISGAFVVSASLARGLQSGTLGFGRLNWNVAPRSEL